jgi:hypothetical protein
MADKAETRVDEKKSPGFTRLLVWGFALLLVYVLSIGPVAILIKNGWFDRHKSAGKWAEIFYAPVILAYDKVPSFRESLDWYIGLWTGESHHGRRD